MCVSVSVSVCMAFVCVRILCVCEWHSDTKLVLHIAHAACSFSCISFASIYAMGQP